MNERVNLSLSLPHSLSLSPSLSHSLTHSGMVFTSTRSERRTTTHETTTCVCTAAVSQKKAWFQVPLSAALLPFLPRRASRSRRWCCVTTLPSLGVASFFSEAESCLYSKSQLHVGSGTKENAIRSRCLRNLASTLFSRTTYWRRRTIWVRDTDGFSLRILPSPQARR